MKLVELLAREIVEWPEGAEMAVQDDDGCFKFGAGRNPKDDGYGIWVRDIEIEHEMYNGFNSSEKTIDRNTAIVTRAQWQAERDRQKGGEWKRHRGGKQPVADDVFVEVKLRDGDIQQHKAKAFAWSHSDCDVYANIMQYRVISQPQAEEPMKAKFDGVKLEFSRDGVNFSEIGTARIDNICDFVSTEAKTDQIDGPIKWRDTIIHCQAIIEDCEREIERNIQLLDAEGMMMQTDSKKAMQHYVPDVDMSDWRNWKVGDIILVSESSEICDGEHAITYVEPEPYDGALPVAFTDENGAAWPEINEMKFIRRP